MICGACVCGVWNRTSSFADGLHHTAKCQRTLIKTVNNCTARCKEAIAQCVDPLQ
jgi:hypothetical protein